MGPFFRYEAEPEKKNKSGHDSQDKTSARIADPKDLNLAKAAASSKTSKQGPDRDLEKERAYDINQAENNGKQFSTKLSKMTSRVQRSLAKSGLPSNSPEQLTETKKHTEVEKSAKGKVPVEDERPNAKSPGPIRRKKQNYHEYNTGAGRKKTSAYKNSVEIGTFQRSNDELKEAYANRTQDLQDKMQRFDIAEEHEKTIDDENKKKQTVEEMNRINDKIRKLGPGGRFENFVSGLGNRGNFASDNQKGKKKGDEDEDEWFEIDLSN